MGSFLSITRFFIVFGLFGELLMKLIFNRILPPIWIVIFMWNNNVRIFSEWWKSDGCWSGSKCFKKKASGFYECANWSLKFKLLFHLKYNFTVLRLTVPIINDSRHSLKLLWHSIRHETKREEKTFFINTTPQSWSFWSSENKTDSNFHWKEWLRIDLSI